MDERIKRVMADTLGVNALTLGDNPSPATVGAWDSLRHMNLILALEAEFNVEFRDAAVPELTSYARIRENLTQLGVPSGAPSGSR